MALPSGVTMVTVEHTITDVAGDTIPATVQVRPRARIWAPADTASLLPEYIPVTVTNGTYTFQVPAVDDPQLVGTDVTFLVVETVLGKNTTHRIAPTLAQAPGPVGLFDTLTSAPIPGGAENFIERIADTVEGRIDAIPVAEKGVALGVAELDGDGDVVDASGAKVSGSALTDAKAYTDQEVATRAPTVHDHTRADISDASALGRTLMAVADAKAGRAALDITVDTSVGTRIMVGGVMVRGDTGWRDIHAERVQDARWEIGSLRVRRVDDTIYLRARVNLTSSSGSAAALWEAPTGFAPIPYELTPAIAASRGLVGVGAPSTAGRVTMVPATGYEIPTTAGRYTVAMPTTDPWPAVLPGIPA